MTRSRKLAAIAAVLALTAIAPTGALATETPGEGAVDCVRDGAHALINAIQGYPQPVVCDPV